MASTQREFKAALHMSRHFMTLLKPSTALTDDAELGQMNPTRRRRWDHDWLEARRYARDGKSCCLVLSV